MFLSPKSTFYLSLAFILGCLFTQWSYAKSHNDLALTEGNLLRFVGTAYAIDHPADTERILYTEHHNIQLDSSGSYLSAMVEYRDPSGVLLATKDLSFANQASIPELRFTDLRTETVYETKNLLDKLTYYVQLDRRLGTALDSNKIKIEKLTRSVVDAGFDQFVLERWDDILKGKKVKLDFLALTRASFFEFFLEKKRNHDGHVVLSLQPSSFFIGLLVDPITLTYDLASKRLLRFEGLTNIEKVVEGRGKGENHTARIEYEYLQ